VPSSQRPGVHTISVSSRYFVVTAAFYLLSNPALHVQFQKEKHGVALDIFCVAIRDL